MQRVTCAFVVSALVALHSGCSSVPALPEVAKGYTERANVKLAVNKDYYGAIEDFTQAIEFDGGDADAYLGRGIAHQKIGNTQSAREDFRKAVSLNPGLAPAVKPFQ